MSVIENARKIRAIIEDLIIEVDDKTASNAVVLFPKLKGNGALIAAGTRIEYNGTLKRAAVDLWDTLENNPDNAPSLWHDIQYKDGIRFIPQTIFSTEAFELGELGWWNNKIYESLINANVYTPDQYPAGWKLKE